MLAGRPRFHSVYSIGLLLTVVAGFVSAMVTPNSKDSLMHLFTWWIAIFVIPLGLSLWNPARRVVAMLAGAYILGQLVDTGFAIVHDGTGRWTGLSTYPNYFGQAGLLSCALAIFLLGEQRELDGWFYAGVAVILAAVFAHPLLGRRQGKARQPELLGTSESHGVVD